MSITVLTSSPTRALALYSSVDSADAIMLVNQASAAVERYCGRIFAQQVYLEVQPLPPDGCVILTHTPVVAIASVLIGTTATTDYLLENAESGLLWLPWHPRRYVWVWSTEAVGWRTVSVTYTAGYILPEQISPPEPTGPTMPADLEAATIAWATQIEAKQTEIAEGTVRSKTLGLTGDRIEYAIASSNTTTGQGRPVMATDVLEGYRRVVVR